MIRFRAHFDGEHLCPVDSVSFPKNVLLDVTVEELRPDQATSYPKLADFFDRIEAQAGLIEGPTDWAAEHDHYLYGATKKSAPQVQ
jgi:hypothetical protein